MATKQLVIDELRKGKAPPSIKGGGSALDQLRRSSGRDTSLSQRGGNAASYLASAAANYPADLASLGIDTIRGFLSPVSTASGIVDVAKGLIGLVPGVETDDAALNSAVDYIKDNYGSAEKILESFRKRPATTLADFSLGLGLVGKGGRLSTKAGTAGRTASDITSKVARVADPITVLEKGGAVGGKIARVGGQQILTPLQSSATGVPEQALNIARDIGDTDVNFKKGREGKVTQDEIVKDVKKVYKDFDKQNTTNLKSAAARANLKSIPANEAVLQAIRNAVDKTYANYTSQNNRFLLSGTQKKHLDTLVRNEIDNFLNTPEIQNALGIQEIIRGIDANFPSATSKFADARAVHSELRNNIRQVLEEYPDIPNDYKAALEDYSLNKKKIEKAEIELSLGRAKGSDKTIYDKVKSSFSEEGGISESALRALPGSDAIINKMAGKLVSSPFPSQYLRVAAGVGAGTTGALWAGISPLGVAGIVGSGALFSPKFGSFLQTQAGRLNRRIPSALSSPTAQTLRAAAPYARLAGTAQEEIFEPIGKSFYGLGRGLL